MLGCGETQEEVVATLKALRYNHQSRNFAGLDIFV